MVRVARDYAEWCGLSGLYLANLSHVDRYRTYAESLSPVGLTVVIVSEFLEDSNPTLDVNDWRTHHVYELGPDQTERIQRTVAALREIGAESLAQAVTTSRSSSPFEAIQNLLTGGVPDLAALSKSVNPLDLLGSLQKSLKRMRPGEEKPSAGKSEDRQQVEELLEQYAQAHQEELQADIDRHGDPRLEPGFTVERRRHELDAMRTRWFSHRTQAEAIETLTIVMQKIPKILVQKTPGKEKKSALHLKQMVRQFREKSLELKKTAEAERSELLHSFWPRLQAFETEWADLIHPDVIGNPQLRRAAKEIGEFTSESSRQSTVLEWDTPRDLDCDWTTFRLTVDVPPKSKAAMQAAFQAIERLQQQFHCLQQDWRRQALESFRETYQGQMDEEDLEGYDLNDNGEPTDAAILDHVESGSLVLSTSDAQGRSFSLSAWLAVDWDQEHGQELDCDIDLDDSSDDSTLTFQSGEITLKDVGPRLTPEALQQFESGFGLTLPRDYREFLLQFNGGVPSKSYLIQNREGGQDNWHIVRFLSVSGATAAPYPQDSLEARLHLEDGTRLTSHLLPIARIRKGSFDPLNQSAVLAIFLSGRKVGQIGTFEAEMMLAPLLETGDSVEVALNELVNSPQIVAKSFSSLWKKLQPAPEVLLPDWLQFLRRNDINSMLAWAADGGKTSERFIEPGADLQPTVADLVAAEATDEMLQALVTNKIVSPKALRESWRTYLFLDIARFQKLKPHLPKDHWHYAFLSPQIWDQPELLQEIATAQVNIEAPIDAEGGTALHHAVQLGRKDAVRWLLDHGADPNRTDRYGRNASIYAEHGRGRDCLALLQGRPEPAPPDANSLNIPAYSRLNAAAAALAPGQTLRLQIEIQSPPVTRIEQVYYAGVGCHYRLTFEVNNSQVTFNDTRSPRQDYLHGKCWNEVLFLPILQWPELTPLWETLSVQEFDLKQAIKIRNYKPVTRPDLKEDARSLLEQAFTA